MTRLTRLSLAALPALLLVVSGPAGAQEQAAEPSASRTPSSAQARQGSLVVEPIRNAFVITPDVKVTDLDHTTRTLVGAYGGLLMEDTLLVGAGGYWLADGSRDRKMAYGGFVAQWTLPAGRRLRVGVRGLVGAGRATLLRTVSLQVPTGFDGHPRFDHGFDHGSGLSFTTIPRQVRFRPDFFVAEPQADVVLKVTRWLALDAGAGYRAVAWADGFEHQLRGAVGSLGVRIGRGL